jgi:hypothetical protein
MNMKNLQIKARNAIAGAIVPEWTDHKNPEKLAAIMVALVDAAVSIAIQIWGRDHALERLCKMVNSASERFHGD